jgi:hypothetical protein
MAAIALPIEIAATVYAVWRLMMLQRFCIDQRASELTQQPGV